jgi:hypothetical protein
LRRKVTPMPLPVLGKGGSAMQGKLAPVMKAQIRILFLRSVSISISSKILVFIHQRQSNVEKQAKHSVYFKYTVSSRKI